MPFNLTIKSISGPTWSTEAPSWLNGASPPREVYEVLGAMYERDRYLLMSAVDLFHWHFGIFEIGERQFATSPLGEWDETVFSELNDKLARSRDKDLFLLHWQEWESGLN